MKILNKVEVQSRIHGVWAAVTLYLSSFPSSSASLNSIESAFVFLVLWHFVNNNLFNSSRFKTMVVWMYNSVDQCCFTTPVECFFVHYEHTLPHFQHLNRYCFLSLWMKPWERLTIVHHSIFSDSYMYWHTW